MRIVLALLLLLVTAGLASAERRVALVIGNDRYETLRPLTNAGNDARTVESLLEGLGFKVFPERDRDLRRLRRALEDFREDAAGADVALVFFAGHGVEIAGRNHLLPVDAAGDTAEALAESSLPLEELRDLVAGIAPVGLIIIDACRNDPFGGASQDGRGATGMSPRPLPSGVAPGLGRVGRADNMLFAFAAAPGATASDGAGGNSPFTAALSKYLATDGLEIRSALTLVQQEVYDATGGGQLPYVESGLPQLFFASTARSDLPERERLLLAMADVTPQMRAEIETVATDAQMPLAPLFGALISSDLAAADAETRGVRLREAAAAFVKVREEMKTLSADDPAVAALRREAEAQLALGAFDTARQKLSEAAALDAVSRATLKTNLIERTLSEATTHYIAAGAARADLRHRLAIESYERAVALYGELREGDIGSPDLTRLLGAQGSLADLHRAVGETAKARAALTALLGMQRLASAHRSEFRIARDTSSALDQLGDVQRVEADLAGAMESYQSSLSIKLRLLPEHPHDSELHASIAASHDHIGEIYSTRGDDAEALTSYRTALGLRQDLATRSQEEDPDLIDELAISHFKVGHAMLKTGDAEGAVEAFTASETLDRKLVGLFPDDRQRKTGLAYSIEGRATVLAALGRYSEAIAALDEARLTRLEDVARDPEDLRRRWTLSATTHKIGTIQADAGAPRAAIETLLETRHLRAELSAADPANTGWIYDLATTDSALGNARAELGDKEAAVGDWIAAREGWATVAAREPSNPRWRGVLAEAQEKIGTALAEIGRTEEGLAALRDSLALRMQLAAELPDDAIAQFDVVRSHVAIANLGVENIAHFRAAYDIALELRGAGMLEEDHANLPAQLEAMLRQLGALP